MFRTISPLKFHNKNLAAPSRKSDVLVIGLPIIHKRLSRARVDEPQQASAAVLTKDHCEFGDDENRKLAASR